MASERVLSIQSHVVYGYVGGKAAVFPLQCLGYDVDVSPQYQSLTLDDFEVVRLVKVVNTVHFSNHSGYGRMGGTKTTATELNVIFDCMENNQLMAPTRLLTGYIPGAEGLSAVANLARKLKAQRPDLVYLLDPVMGDAGQLYVAADVIPIYRELLPTATIIAPNWFEVELLTQIKLTSLPSLQQALSILHNTHHVPNVVISSIPLSDWLLDALPTNIKPKKTDREHILCIASSSSFSLSRQSDADAAKPSRVHAQHVPLIPGYFSGVGDLFSALLLAHFSPPSSSSDPAIPPLAHAAAHALATTHHILSVTYEHVSKLPAHEQEPTDDEADKKEPQRRVRRMRGRELRLVQTQGAIRGEGVDVRPMRAWDEFW